MTLSATSTQYFGHFFLRNLPQAAAAVLCKSSSQLSMITAVDRAQTFADGLLLISNYSEKRKRGNSASWEHGFNCFFQ